MNRIFHARIAMGQYLFLLISTALPDPVYENADKLIASEPAVWEKQEDAVIPIAPPVEEAWEFPADVPPDPAI